MQKILNTLSFVVYAVFFGWMFAEITLGDESSGAWGVIPLAAGIYAGYVAYRSIRFRSRLKGRLLTASLLLNLFGFTSFLGSLWYINTHNELELAAIGVFLMGLASATVCGALASIFTLVAIRKPKHSA